MQGISGGGGRFKHLHGQLDPPPRLLRPLLAQLLLSLVLYHVWEKSPSSFGLLCLPRVQLRWRRWTG